ncbi:hexokinase-3 isoform X7 [Benincasa hispida]|uniref:hexokinase-3 isoform X7 n=1 Tax=Benincasa hispida TaxID=102211 RepID=UPI00190009D7|nr:hexokinase-3 isoform X7 [Benincasa hispida]
MGRVVVGVAVSVAVVACIVAAGVVSRRVQNRGKWRRVVRVLKELEEACETSVGRLKQVVDAMAVEMHAGLASEGGSKLKMLLTFVDNLPDGNEMGTHYALDLGGTNFRVLSIQLEGNRSSILDHDVERLPIPQHLMTSTGRERCCRVLGTSNDKKRSQHKSHSTLIIGTGTNACYLERTDAIIKCQGLLTTSGFMVVNMEWGNFWSSHLPRTSYDIDLDFDSPNPNDQGFEKMISGMYLGDVVRRVILRMSQESDIFGFGSSRLSMPFVLTTPLMAEMHEDESLDLRDVARILNDILGIPEVSLKARKLIVRICDVVTRRAARLVAAGILGILKKMGRDGTGGIAGARSRTDVNIKRTVVAVEGGLYTNYTMFREYLHEALIEILGEEIAKHIILKVTEDGSGIGAALLAASHSSN